MIQEERREEDCMYHGLKHENMMRYGSGRPAWAQRFWWVSVVFFPLKRDDSMIELSGQVAKCLEKIRKRGSIEAILI